MKCSCGNEIKDPMVNFHVVEPGINISVCCDKCHRVYSASIEGDEFTCIFEGENHKPEEKTNFCFHCGKETPFDEERNRCKTCGTYTGWEKDEKRIEKYREKCGKDEV